MSLDSVFTNCQQLVDGVPVEDWCNPDCPTVGNIVLSASVVDDTSINLTWDDPIYDGTSFYQVNKSTTPNFTPDSTTIIYTTNPDTLSFMVEGLTEGTTYYFLVVKRNASVAYNSNYASATPSLPADFPPNASLFLSATAISGTEVDLAWTPADPFDPTVSWTYNLYRSTTPNFTPGAGNLIASGIVKATHAYNDTGLNPSLIYYYILKQITSVDSILSNYLSSSGTVVVTAQKGTVSFVGLASDSMMQLSGSWSSPTLGFHDGQNTVTVNYGKAFPAPRTVTIFLPVNAMFTATVINNSPTGFQIAIGTLVYVKTLNPTKYTFSYGFTVKTN